MLLLRNAQTYQEHRFSKKDILIKGGKIEAVTASGMLDAQGCKEVED